MQTPFFCLLEYQGIYWYYPGWTDYPNWTVLNILPSGKTERHLIDPFAWPDAGGTDIDSLVSWRAGQSRIHRYHRKSFFRFVSVGVNGHHVAKSCSCSCSAPRNSV